jgi:hypothetical protein
MLTKDYENFIEFLSSEEFFYDKLVNLRIPFFFLNNHKKPLSYTETNNLKLEKIKSETEVKIAKVPYLIGIFLQIYS